MTLAVTMTATYPKTEPILKLKNDGELTEGTRFKIQKILENKPKELVAEDQPQAMIMEIVSACSEVLEDAAQAKAAGKELPSLEEERAAHAAIANKLAEEQREREERQKQLERLEEQRMEEVCDLSITVNCQKFHSLEHTGNHANIGIGVGQRRSEATEGKRTGKETKKSPSTSINLSIFDRYWHEWSSSIRNIDF